MNIRINSPETSTSHQILHVHISINNIKYTKYHNFHPNYFNHQRSLHLSEITITTHIEQEHTLIDVTKSTEWYPLHNLILQCSYYI